VPKVYLAGPDVFLPDAERRGFHLKTICTERDVIGLWPFDNEIDHTYDKRIAGKKIFEANVSMLRQSDAVIANLNPFRGPSADVGTVWEIGYAKALGLPVVGYSFDMDQYRTRVLKMKIPHDGMHIEDFDARDNIMVVEGCDEIYTSFIDAVLAVRCLLKLDPYGSGGLPRL